MDTGKIFDNFNFKPAYGYFCRLLITFANILSDQASQNVRPDLYPNCFDTLMVFLN